jgi:hypothetical protein
MNHTFEERLKAAVRTGWCVLLIAVAFLAAQYFAYLQIAKTKPEGFLSLMGPDYTWPEALKLWMLIMSLWKMWCWGAILLMLWLTLWSRKLNR